ncbi:MAG: 50S ribosomal protein L28 [Chloroflexi bacterium]|nr:50S ribosomal protein L28 [Chloroflexota bacterium]
MAICDICSKVPASGYAVSHSKRHTKRKWNPNVQRATIYQNGKARKVNICTRCLRTTSKVR